jgi:hypothetical protein
MKKNQGMRYTIIAAFVAACGASGAALAVDEVEENYPLQSAQRLTVGAERSVTANGVIGTLAGPMVNDVDIYSFYARKDDVLVIDIDGGYKPSGPARISVDTFLTLFGPDGTVLRANDDLCTGCPLDDGSAHKRDAYIDKFKVEKDGVYYVGVTAFPRILLDGGAILDRGSLRYNGDYGLTISGVSPSVMQINIDIKPGNGGSAAPINPKSRGSIPVALLSSDTFDALKVDMSSLTFGSTGDEKSLQRCGKDGSDVNNDGRLDLVCHFENQVAKFGATDLEGTLKGKIAGMPIEGRGLLKVVPPLKSDAD